MLIFEKLWSIALVGPIVGLLLIAPCLLNIWKTVEGQFLIKNVIILQFVSYKEASSHYLDIASLDFANST